MFFTIDPQSGVAIYEQIVRQVKFAIAEGTIKPGQLLPSVRALSLQLALNPNTVARAYLQLQSENILESLRGRGVVVSVGAGKVCRDARRDIIADRLRLVLSEALHAGLTKDEIEVVIAKQLKELAKTVSTIATSAEEAE